MNSFEFNKIAGAILGTLLLAMGLGIVADFIFESGELETPGYVVDVPEADATVETAQAPAEEPITVLLASATVEGGQSISKKCAACHTFEQGGANKVGPNLWNIVNATPASHDGFKYSSAMQAFAADNVWNYENLNGFLLAPKKYIDGTAMGFAGLKKAEDRADMIAYLRSLSDSPAVLPEAEPAAADMPAEIMDSEAATPEEPEGEPAVNAVPEERLSPDAPIVETPADEAPAADPVEPAAPALDQNSGTTAN
uniref:c-type cytochrome n=1 Tax=Pararhizobium sp. IMCC3301 TaxID=3067904 RepID=UPI0027412694|nr:cytochrome c family protein [Pararhizobium sp. IMCC3301]